MNISKTILVSAISGFLISGCGGGGDGGNTVTTPPVTTPPVITPSTIAGTAAKGIVLQGIVTAYTLNTTGVKGTEVGSAITNKDDGAYTLDLSSDYDGTSALLLELTSNATTEMICDALNGCGTDISTGDTFTPPTDFTLSTIIPAAGTNATIDAQITAFTHIAAKSIQSNQDSSIENILTTTSRINQIVGTNILETVPVNIADGLSDASADQQKYTVMLAALAEQAFDGDMVANLEAFADDFSNDGDFGDANGLAMDSFVAAANAEIANSATDLDDTVETSLTQLTTAIAALTKNGQFQPSETSGTIDDDVAKAKALVTEVRTWKDSLENLESPADAFATEAGTIIDTLDEDSSAVTEVLARTLSAAQTAINTALTNETSVPASVNVNDRAGNLLGVIFIDDNSDQNSQEYKVEGTNIGTAAVNATLKLNESLSSTELASGDITFEISADANNSNTKVAFEDITLTATLADAFDVEDEDAEPNISAISIKGGLKVDELNTGMPTGKSIMGNAEIKLVTLDGIQSTENDENLSLEKIAISDLTVSSDSGSSTGLSIALVMNNASEFDTFGYLENGNETSTNFLDATLMITGAIDLATFPEATLTISADKTGIDQGTFTATLGYDGRTMQIVANTTDGTESNSSGDLTFTNADGASLKLNSTTASEITGAVSIGDKTIGTIEETSSGIVIIRYNDGTFESL